MKQTKKLSRKVISYVLTLVMVFSTMTGIVPGMSITAQAAPAETLLTTITATGTTTYSESPAGVVNVTLSIDRYYDDLGWFGGTVTVTQKEGYTITKCRFNARRGAVDDTEEPFTFSIDRNYVKTVEVYGYQTSPYASIINTTNAVKFAGLDWYLIEYDDSTVTLLSKECVGASKFNENQSNGYEYSGSTVESFVNSWYTSHISTDAKAAVNGSGMFLLTTDQANKLSTDVLKCSPASGAYENSSYWWLCSPGTTTTSAARVNGDTGTVADVAGNVWIAFGVRPALKLDLSKVTFDSDAKTFVLKPKTAQTVTAPTAATGLTYSGQEQALLTEGASVSEGNGNTEATIQYSLTPDDDTSWVAGLADIKATNAGTYKVYYRVAGNDTYADFVSSDEQAVSVTIAKADPVTPGPYSAEYGQQAKDVALPTGWSWVEPEKKFESTDVVELKAYFEGDDNYNQKNDVLISVMVVPADATISYAFRDIAKEYGSKSFTNEITNTGDATPTYTSSNTSVATVDETGLVTIKGIGETTITATVADNDHYFYSPRKASYTLKVNPVSTVISTVPTATDITYGQKLSESTLSGGVATVDGSEETVAGTFAWKEPDTVPNASESGEYDVEFTPTDTNYAKSTCKVTIKVNKKTVSATELEDAQKPVAKTGDDTVYTGKPIELVTAPTADLPLDYEAFYSTDDGDSWSKDIPKKTDPGTYTVKVKYVSEGGNCNDIALDDITATITPADKTALTDAIAAAKAYYDRVKDNTDYSEAADKLDKEIKAAEKVAAKDKVTKSEVSTATEAVNTAKAAAEAEVKDIDDTKAAQAVIDKINELKPVENIKTEDRTKIEAAREAYKNLSDDQKTKLTGLDSTAVSTLEAAEKALDTADKTAADKVIEAINTLPAKEDVTASDKEAVEAARAAYDALTASQKDKIDTATLQKLADAEEALVALGELDKNVVAFNSEKNVQKAEAVKLAKEDDSDAVRKLIADAREAIDALAYDKNKSLDENKAVLAAIITELGNALEEQRELEKILAVVKIDQGETVAEVDKTAIKEEDVETVTNVAKSTDADLSEAATTCVKQIVEESETVEDSDKNIVIVPALDVKGKEYSVTETDATMTLDIEAVYTSYETTSDIKTAKDVKSATEAEDETEKAKVKEIGSGKLDTEGTPVNVKIEVPAAFAGVLGATTETVKASPATIYVKHTHKNKNYEYNASLYCEGSRYFVEFVNPNGFSPFTLSGNSTSVASIGDKNYTDLQSAIDDAADGSTIKLTNDNDVSATINTEKTITIDKDNHTGNVDIKAADTLLLTKTDNENGTTTYKTVTKYKVTFDNNGGKGTMPAQEIGGTAALNANAFTKEGYTFDGWNTKSDGSGTAYADKADVTPAADMTLYAQWKENPKPDDKDKTDAEVEAVKTKINALKAADKITTADKAAIEAADKAYDALSEARKKLIDAATLKKLTDAKAALKAAEKAESDKAAADAVKTRINALKAADKITTTDKVAIEEARKAYDALSADRKKLVDAATLKKLTDAEKALTTAEANDKAAKELEAAKKEAQAAMNEQVTVTQKGNKFTVKWKKASSADGYYVYARYCGKKITKPAKIIEKNTTTKTVITKIGGKKINQKKNFRVYVAPYKIVDGKKVTLGKSMTAHLVGSKNTKYSNVKKLTLTKSKYTVKVGKTAKIKAKVTLVNKNKKHIPKSHGAKFRYKSSDTSIATVDKNGKVKGIRKGTCTIYVYSINGLMKKAKVTVK